MLIYLIICFPLRLSVGVAMLCSFLLGLGDSCFNTQLMSIIGFMFPDNSAPAFASLKLIQVRCFLLRVVRVQLFEKNNTFAKRVIKFEKVQPVVSYKLIHLGFFDY